MTAIPGALGGAKASSRQARPALSVFLSGVLALAGCVADVGDDPSELEGSETSADVTAHVEALGCNGQLTTAVTCSTTKLSDSAFYTYDSKTVPCSSARLLKCDTLGQKVVGATTYNVLRVMYRSTLLVRPGNTTQEVPAAGLIYVPTTAATNRPVLANTHGLIGLVNAPSGVAAGCAPSQRPDGRFDLSIMHGLADELELKAGVRPAIVVPDFAGLGPSTGYGVPDPYQVEIRWGGVLVKRVKPFSQITHPYISIESEGRATIDLVRTAAEMNTQTGVFKTGVAAQPRWFVAGASQGGHAALATGEVWARGYDAGKTTLLGVIAGAPGGDLDKDGNVEPALRPLLASAVLAGLSVEQRDVVPSRYLSDQALVAFSETFNKKCLNGTNDVLSWLVTWASYIGQGNGFRGVLPWNDPALVPVLAANSPGRRPSGVPLFIGQKTHDPFIDLDRTWSTVQSARASNPTKKVYYCLYAGTTQPGQGATNHTTVLSAMASTTASLVSCSTRNDGTPEARMDARRFVRENF